MHAYEQFGSLLSKPLNKLNIYSFILLYFTWFLGLIHTSVKLV